MTFWRMNLDFLKLTGNGKVKISVKPSFAKSGAVIMALYLALKHTQKPVVRRELAERQRCVVTS